MRFFALGLLAMAACSPTGPVAVFPKSFQFGFATIAYQSEGSLRGDGTRVASNWSEWDELGKIKGGQHNDHGNGFFEGYTTDLDLAASLGANAFSYAIDWARLEPAPGVFDDAELGRIVAIVQAMRARKLRPVIVMFHWVTPTWVQSPKQGIDLLSRSDRAFAEAFVPLVDHVVPALAGLVDDWLTFEEPYSIVGAEYLAGLHPPGKFLDIKSSQRALVNLMYLHARTYHHIHQLDTQDADGDGVAAFVGFENLALESVPLDATSPDDVQAAKHFDYIVNHQFMKGIWEGDIDVDLDGRADNLKTDPPEGHDEELRHTLDFIGLNYYQRMRVEAGGILSKVAPFFGTPHLDVREYDTTLPHSDRYWEISSPGLRTVIEEYSKYGLPMNITENGEADLDDDERPFYILDHLRKAGEAIAAGYDIRGYYYWTISDNFEWNDGIEPRYGLFQVDFTKPNFPRTRTPRAADVFEEVAKRGAIDRALWDRIALPSYPVGPP